MPDHAAQGPAVQIPKAVENPFGGSKESVVIFRRRLQKTAAQHGRQAGAETKPEIRIDTMITTAKFMEQASG